MQENKALILAAAGVAHRAPQEWAQFISTLVAYTDAKRDECIRSPLDMLPTTQGRAQACNALRELLADCVKTANDIQTKQKLKPQQPH